MEDMGRRFLEIAAMELPKCKPDGYHLCICAYDKNHELVGYLDANDKEMFFNDADFKEFPFSVEGMAYATKCAKAMKAANPHLGWVVTRC